MIDSFRKEYFFLSNFYPCNIFLDGYEYPSLEHAYQASKSIEKLYRDKILSLSKPWEAKAAGKVLRPDWNKIKVNIMMDLINQKFTRHLDLKWKLGRTGFHDLIEGNNWHDNFWGDCYCKKCLDITGQNMLGKILMKQRKEINA